MEPITDTLLSYDGAGEARSVATRACQLVFGRSEAGPDAPPPFIARPGVAWIGQSVLLLPRTTAQRLARRLQDLGATVVTASIAIEPGELARFRPGIRRPNEVLTR